MHAMLALVIALSLLQLGNCAFFGSTSKTAELLTCKNIFKGTCTVEERRVQGHACVEKEVEALRNRVYRLHEVCSGSGQAERQTAGEDSLSNWIQRAHVRSKATKRTTQWGDHFAYL